MGTTYVLSVLLASAIGSVLWWMRRQRATRRLADIDHGRRCVACDSRNMTVTGNDARCNDCMYSVDLAAMRAANISAQDIADLTARKQ